MFSRDSRDSGCCSVVIQFFLCVFCSHVMAKRSIFHFHYLDLLNCAAGRSRPGSELE